MLRSMYSGISGMKNFQSKLDVVANNISNVNTYGFKKGRVTFKDVAYQTISGASAGTAGMGGTNAKQIGLGSAIGSIDNIHTQGSVQTTGRGLDLAIQGDGYLVVKQGDKTFYTRDGNLTLDDDGYLVTASGMKVQGYDGGAVKDIQINLNATISSKTTTKVPFEGNIHSEVAGTVLEQTMNVTDKNGVQHTLKVIIEKTNTSTAQNDYKMTIVNPKELDASGNPKTVSTVNPVTFPTTTTSTITLDIKGDGVTADDISVTLDFTKVTNDKALANTAKPVPDGNSAGKIESFTIGSSGEVVGVFSNGLTQTLGTIALATFANTGGLMHEGGNLWSESINSGPANITKPGQGAGKIEGGSLEMSNVDLSEEFSDLIISQRGFQANSRIITTSDQILEELVNLKR